MSKHTAGPMTALNTVFFGALHPSAIFLPIVALADIPKNPHFKPNVS